MQNTGEEVQARERGWRRLRFLSTNGNDYDRDYFGDSSALTPAMRAQQEFKDGQEWDMPALNVFQREADGVRHRWCSELLYVPGSGPRLSAQRSLRPAVEYGRHDARRPWIVSTEAGI